MQLLLVHTAGSSSLKVLIQQIQVFSLLETFELWFFSGVDCWTVRVAEMAARRGVLGAPLSPTRDAPIELGIHGNFQLHV